jgi:N-succinyldiaminopimelate aminotransferase
MLPLRAPDFALDLEGLERVLNSRTKLVLFNSPTNPSGRVYPRVELEGLAGLLRKHPQVVLMTDEVYEHLVYPPHVHIPMATLEGMRDRTVLISSTSKTLSMTGWKVGYVYAPAPLTQAVRAAHQFLTFCAVSPLQAAMAEAIDKLPEYLPSLALEYLQRRDRWVETLRRLGFTLEAPQGTYFAVTDVAQLGYEDDMSFCLKITTGCRVAAIPCSAFYTHKEVGKTLVRWAFCKGLETLDEAARRLESLR